MSHHLLQFFDVSAEQTSTHLLLADIGIIQNGIMYTYAVALYYYSQFHFDVHVRFRDRPGRVKGLNASNCTLPMLAVIKQPPSIRRRQKASEQPRTIIRTLLLRGSAAARHPNSVVASAATAPGQLSQCHLRMRTSSSQQAVPCSPCHNTIFCRVREANRHPASPSSPRIRSQMSNGKPSWAPISCPLQRRMTPRRILTQRWCATILFFADNPQVLVVCYLPWYTPRRRHLSMIVHSFIRASSRTSFSATGTCN